MALGGLAAFSAAALLRLSGLELRVEDFRFSPTTGELNVNKNGKRTR